MNITEKALIYRKLNTNDINLFIKLRCEFLKEIDKELIINSEIINSLRLYYKKHLIDRNEFIGIICEYYGKVISVAYLSIYERPANYNFINGKIGVLLNVYTYPEYRRKGISTKIIKEIIEEAKKINITMIELSTTKEGENVYKKIGFIERKSRYMTLKL
jgi:GNAT superfamily N-acetyltransferase